MAKVDVVGREQREAAVPMLAVVPREEPAAERVSRGIGSEARRKIAVVLEGLEVGLGERIVVGDVRTTQRADDAEIGEQLGGVLR
jgi:hypothetical protein